MEHGSAKSSPVTRLIRLMIKYIVIPGIILGVVSLIAVDQWARYRFGASLHQMAGRHLPRQLNWQREQRPSLTSILDIIEVVLPEDNRYRFGPVPNSPPPIWAKDWHNSLVGPSVGVMLPPPTYDRVGRPTPFVQGEGLTTAVGGSAHSTVLVASSGGFLKAVKDAVPGQIITLVPGTYRLRGRSIPVKNAGTKYRPIVVRAAQLGEVRLEFELLEGFHVLAPYWVFENLEINGACANDQQCEHAFHIVGAANGIIIRNNVIKNFNAHIKINGISKRQQYPDGGLIEHNLLLNDRIRRSSLPASPIDAVAVSDWYVRRNFIGDFGKSNKDPSGAGFFKGGGSFNIFEQNAVVCEFRHQGGVRIGLSFGDGGTGRGSQRSGTFGTEQFAGSIRSNLIANCPLDVGIYLMKSSNTTVSYNRLVNTLGIDVRFPNSDAIFVSNNLSGRILSRDGGTYEEFFTGSLPNRRFDPQRDFASPEIQALLGEELGFGRLKNH